MEEGAGENSKIDVKTARIVEKACGETLLFLFLFLMTEGCSPSGAEGDIKRDAGCG